MNSSIRILLFEDNPGDADLLEDMLTAAGMRFELKCAERLSAGIDQLRRDSFDVILLDLGLPDSQGLATLMLLNEARPEAPVIVLTGLADEAIGTHAVKEGAQDYLIKGQIDKNLLARAINYAIERKKAEAAILAAARDWSVSFDAMSDGVSIHDADHTILNANRSLGQLLGKTASELIGEKCYQIFHGKDCPITDCPLTRTRDTYQRAYSEIFEPTLNKWLAVSTSPVFDDSDRLIKIVHTVRDITERRSLENQLRHAQKLEGIGQLAGGIAHDFNNVLNAVVGYAGLLQMQMDEADPLRKFVDEIASAGMRGAALTQQILAFSRKQVLDMKPADLNGLIRGLEKMLHRLVREDISIEFKLFDKDLTVLADASQIDQILINLATNARDAMPSGGRLRISTDFFAMDEEYVVMQGYGKAGDYALLTVSDTGCGMSTKTLSRIFEPFFTTKEVGRGTGLGLAVVHGLVKQHNGFINVYSEVGNGTVFKIFLPLTEHREDETEESPVAEIRGGTEMILIAEDDAPLRRLSSITLKNAGYHVIEAVDGEDALRKFADDREKIRLVILDGIMPKKNGKEVYDEIYGIAPEMKAIFMSGYAEEIFTHGGIPGKNMVFIPKPVKPHDLLRKVREVLDR